MWWWYKVWVQALPRVDDSALNPNIHCNKNGKINSQKQMYKYVCNQQMVGRLHKHLKNPPLPQTLI